MKFLVDEQLPPKLAKHLCRLGLDCVHVRDLRLERSDDKTIWRVAQSENRVVIAKDRDYLALAARSADAGKLVWVRLGNCDTQTILDAWDRAMEDTLRRLNSGQQIVELL